MSETFDKCLESFDKFLDIFDKCLRHRWRFEKLLVCCVSESVIQLNFVPFIKCSFDFCSDHHTNGADNRETGYNDLLSFFQGQQCHLGKTWISETRGKMAGSLLMRPQTT